MGGVFSSPPVQRKLLYVVGEKGGAELQGTPPIFPPTIAEGPSSSWEIEGMRALLKYQNDKGSPGTNNSAVILRLSLRSVAAFNEARLATSVHPNPGPGATRGRRGRGEESKRARC